jgi:hypothetical protein
MMRRKKAAKRHSPKIILLLPDLEQSKNAVLNFLRKQRRNLLSRCRELTNTRAYHFIGHRHIHIGDRAGNARVSPFGQPLAPSGHKHRQAAVFMRIGLGVFVDENQARVVEQRAIAFRNGFELRHQIRELLYVPPANVA